MAQNFQPITRQQKNGRCSVASQSEGRIIATPNQLFSAVKYADAFVRTSEFLLRIFSVPFQLSNAEVYAQQIPKMSAMNEQEPREVKDCDFPPGMPVNANTFPGKLWKLVSDDFYQSINWSNNGTSIGIDALQFKHEVLKCDDSVFKTKNFSSFVRQLNLYGFRKITSVHPSSRACEFSNSHPHQQLNSELQHFQHSCFNRAHPELLIRVRRASAAQKRKAQENAEFHGFPNHPHFPRGLGVSSFNTQGILRDRTNLNKPYHNCIPTCKGRQAPFPVSLHANQGKIFGLSLIASTTRGSLIATPTSDQFDFNKLCNPNGQLKKYVVIGRQDAFGKKIVWA